jgi:ABC-type multidrug transport system fused ATPase/permease subunit
MILRHYSSKLRQVRYGVILSLPLVYFLLQFLPPFQSIITALPQSESVFFLYTFIFTFSKPIGGILFGIAFWVIARTLGHTNIVRDYMIISAYGLVLLFISKQAVLLVIIIYPPFGLVTVSFMGLSSYLLLLGVYSSAISVSEDSKLRQSIRNLAIKESRLLDSIGTAHMEQEIQRRVLTLTKQNQNKMEEETGIQSSLTDDDAKEYLEKVIEEVKKERLTP